MGFRWNAFALDLRLEDRAKRPSRLDKRRAAGQHRNEIKVSAQFFSRACLKYNITTDRGLVDQPRYSTASSTARFNSVSMWGFQITASGFHQVPLCYAPCLGLKISRSGK